MRIDKITIMNSSLLMNTTYSHIIDKRLPHEENRESLLSILDSLEIIG